MNEAIDGTRGLFTIKVDSQASLAGLLSEMKGDGWEEVQSGMHETAEIPVQVKFLFSDGTFAIKNFVK